MPIRRFHRSANDRRRTASTVPSDSRRQGAAGRSIPCGPVALARTTPATGGRLQSRRARALGLPRSTGAVEHHLKYWPFRRRCRHPPGIPGSVRSRSQWVNPTPRRPEQDTSRYPEGSSRFTAPSLATLNRNQADLGVPKTSVCDSGDEGRPGSAVCDSPLLYLGGH